MSEKSSGTYLCFCEMALALPMLEMSGKRVGTIDTVVHVSNGALIWPVPQPDATFHCFIRAADYIRYDPLSCLLLFLVSGPVVSKMVVVWRGCCACFQDS